VVDVIAKIESGALQQHEKAGIKPAFS